MLGLSSCDVNRRFIYYGIHVRLDKADDKKKSLDQRISMIQRLIHFRNMIERASKAYDDQDNLRASFGRLYQSRKVHDQ